MARFSARTRSHATEDTATVVTPEYFDHLVSETERPAREPNAKMAQLLRDTQGAVEHR
jgi:hypothetical protein